MTNMAKFYKNSIKYCTLVDTEKENYSKQFRNDKMQIFLECYWFFFRNVSFDEQKRFVGIVGKLL